MGEAKLRTRDLDLFYGDFHGSLDAALKSGRNDSRADLFCEHKNVARLCAGVRFHSIGMHVSCN